jgi:thiamine biosynthesis lipoprotein
MKSRSKPVSRARPLLGTLVEICAWGGAHGIAAVESAFEAVSQVQRLMSVHDPDSDISRLNREAMDRPVRIHAWTAEVLRFALQLQRESGGAFDCGIGKPLEDAGFLPAGTARAGPNGTAASGCLHIDETNRVSVQTPVCLDLGGIAKGFAVDRAVEALRDAGIAAGLVNAGGDLRAFGLDGFPVMVRDPSSPGRFVRAFRLRSGAVATSAGYYASRIVDQVQVMPIFDPLWRRFLQCDFSVTVTAATCMTADALTKVAAILGTEALPLLRRHGADALWWQRGRIRATWEARCPAAA